MIGQRVDFTPISVGHPGKATSVRTVYERLRIDMSPLEIHCLLEYHAYGYPEQDGNNMKPMAQKALLGYGLIQISGESEDGPSSRQQYVISEKGRAHVNHLCSLSHPIKIWVLPNTDSSQNP